MEVKVPRVFGLIYVIALQFCVTASQVHPASYYTAITETISVNGSSSVGRCSNSSVMAQTICTAPHSSVLFDGVIPTLTGLDGSKWASQLLTLSKTISPTDITFDFTGVSDYNGVERVEVVMFNCPQWEIGTSFIRILGSQTRDGTKTISTATTTSCDSLVRVCAGTVSSSLPVIILQFFIDSNSDWVHLAEVTFYSDTMSICLPNVVLLTTTAKGTEKISSTISGSPALSPSDDATISSTTTFSINGTTYPKASSSSIIAIVAVVVSVIVAILITAIVVVAIFLKCWCMRRKKKHAT